LLDLKFFLSSPHGPPAPGEISSCLARIKEREGKEGKRKEEKQGSFLISSSVSPSWDCPKVEFGFNALLSPEKTRRGGGKGKGDPPFTARRPRGEPELP